MPRAAFYVLDPDVGRSRSQGDAVVAGPHRGSSDRDGAGHLDVDAIGVGAVPGGSDRCTPHCDASAGEDGHLEDLAVEQTYAAQQDVFRLTDGQ